MEYVLHESNTARVVARDLQAADIQTAGDMLADDAKGKMPDGMYNTWPRQAWATQAAKALAWGGIALEVRVNGGAIAGVAVATVDAEDKTRLLLQGAVMAWDSDFLQPLLLGLLRRLADERGMPLMRKTTTVSVSYSKV